MSREGDSGARCLQRPGSVGAVGAPPVGAHVPYGTERRGAPLWAPLAGRHRGRPEMGAGGGGWRPPCGHPTHRQGEGRPPVGARRIARGRGAPPWAPALPCGRPHKCRVLWGTQEERGMFRHSDTQLLRGARATKLCETCRLRSTATRSDPCHPGIRAILAPLCLCVR